MADHTTLSALSVALVSTVIIEVISALLLKVRSKWDIILIVLINCVTNPLANLIMTIVYQLQLSDTIVYGSIFVIELMVVLSEGSFYKKVLDHKRIQPLILSLILNLLSFTLGTAAWFLITRF